MCKWNQLHIKKIKYMPDLNHLESRAKHLVSLAQKAGADSCDVIVASGQSMQVGVREGQLENSKRSESDSLSLRVFCGKKVASVTSNSTDNLDQLAERAVAMAKVSPEDPYQGLADRSLLFDSTLLDDKISNLDLLDEYEPTAEVFEKLVLECEQVGMKQPGVSKSMGAGGGCSQSGFVLATSDGFSGSYERSGCSLSVSLVAGEGTGMERDYAFDSAIHFSDLKSPETIGLEAAERVVKRVNPVQVASGGYPIVFDPRVSSSVIGTLAGALSGSSVARKTSFLKDRMNEAIAAHGITIMDDPEMVRRSGSRPFDGEGVSTMPRELVTKGVLKTWLLDSASARELGLTTNGMAGRSGSGTSPSVSNCYLKPGEQSPEEMISSIKEGLYLTETIGHGVNMVTGDYSKGAAGFWIENGEIAFPVGEITIAGNLKDMFLNMQAANDLEFKFGINAPTLLIEGMTIGGK